MNSPTEINVGLEESRQLARASVLGKRGKNIEAEKIYADLLKKNPRCFDALCAVGLMALNKKSYAAAVTLLGLAVEVNPNQEELLIIFGNALIESGNCGAALKIFDRVLMLNPSSAHAHNGAAVAALEVGDLAKGLQSASSAVLLEPKNADFLNNRGNIYKALGKDEDAIGDYMKSLRKDPTNTSTLYNCALTYAKIGSDKKAIEFYFRAESRGLVTADLFYNLAVVLARSDRKDDAKAYYRKALAETPEHFETRFNLAVMLQSEGKLREALEHYDSLPNSGAGSAQALNNRGVLKAALGDPVGALTDYNDSIAASCNFIDPYFNRGNLHWKEKRYLEAEYDYQFCVELDPRHVDSRLNWAVILQEQRRYEECLRVYQQVLEIDYCNFKAIFNTAYILLNSKQIESAIQAYRRAYQLDGKYDFALGLLIHAEALGCQWEHTAERIKGLTREIVGGQAASPPFPLFGLLDSPELQRRTAEIYSDKLYSTVVGAPLERYERQGQQKIRVGYFSADLHAHATSFLISELLELHDRDQFEVLAYSFGHGPKDTMFERIKRAVDNFFDVTDWSDEEICQHAREQKIDIAIDLKGYTQDSRPGIFARRCAPVQINYLGFPGTMGMPSIDYIIADRTVIPECERKHYSEKVLYMPNCYQVNDSKREISNRVFTRQELGLPDEAFVFCCFNNNYKILPETFDIWMRLLTRVPGSVLWLYKDNDTAMKNLRLEAARRGVDSSRLIFAERMPLSEHLARHKLADLFLDTFPCNAHTTASDALWAGLPIITRVGRSFSSRVAASLLTAMNLAELITNDAVQYEELAIRLASNPDQLTKIKSKLHAQKTISTLFDTTRYVRGIQDLLVSTLKVGS